MKFHTLIVIAALGTLAPLGVGQTRVAEADDRPRLIVLTDIGGDPDDQQAMVRLLTYANEFEIEGLIASASGTPGELKEDTTRPELIREIIDAYGQVFPNLVTHQPGYPAPHDLLATVKVGNPHRGVQNLGEGHDTEGSCWIISVADRSDHRPVNVAIWGGSTELAQALWRVRHDRSAEDLARFVSKLRVYSISQQDDTGPWILENFPDLFHVLAMQPEGRDKRDSAYRGMYLGGDMGLTSRAWIDANVREGHGPLGALYPPKTWTAPNPHGALKEGDTPSWLYFLPNGLNVPGHPEWGGWGGRFQHVSGGLYRDAKDKVDGTTHACASVWRWRPAFQADFQARMDWCVLPFDQANHVPSAGFGGNDSRDVIELATAPGPTVDLVASGSSDPDGDELSYRWFVYPEAGTYEGNPTIANAGSSHAQLHIPGDAGGKSIHVILEVTDDGTPPLTASPV